MKSKLVIVAVGLFLYLIFLIANIPAQQVVGRVTTPSNIVIEQVSGTIWDGKARSVFANGMRVNDVKWQLSFLPLLWGSVSLDLEAGSTRQADEISFKGELTTDWLSFTSLSSDDFILYLPTDQVLANVQLPLPVDAGGRFRVIVEELDFDKQCQNLNANGEWLNAQVAGTQGAIQLGSFGAILDCVDNVIVANVQEPNMLGLNLTARITGMRNFSVDARFKPDESLPEEVHQAAQFFGQADAQGYREFKM